MVNPEESPAGTAAGAAGRPRPPTRLGRAFRIAAHYVLLALAAAGAWGTPIEPGASAYLMRAKPWTDTGE